MKSSHQIYNGVVERLKEYRKELGVSQSEMGTYLGVTQSHYLKLEKGMKVISKRSLLTFGESGKDVFWLLTGKKAGNGILDCFLKEFDHAAQRRKMLENIIWVTEEGARISGDDYDESLNKAYRLMKVSNLDEEFIWKKIRDAENLTQMEMAEILDINIKRYRKIEKGEIAEDAEILAALYEKLRYSPMLILDRERYCLDELNEIWGRFESSMLQRFLQYLKYSSEILKYKKEKGICSEQ